MPRREVEKTTKHLVRLYAGDFEELGALYAGSGVSATKVLRILVRQVLLRIRARKDDAAAPTAADVQFAVDEVLPGLELEEDA